jgi:hypothetical protein
LFRVDLKLTGKRLLRLRSVVCIDVFRQGLDFR